MQNNEDEIYSILALFFEEIADPFCRCCYDYRTQNRPDKRMLCNKYRDLFLAYLKTQGIEKIL